MGLKVRTFCVQSARSISTIELVLSGTDR